MLYAGRQIDNDQWSYGGNPAEELADEVRFLVGDTNKDEKLLTDGEVSYAIAKTSSASAAAAILADALAAYFSREVNRTINDVQSVSLGQMAVAYRQKAVELRDAANLLGKPFAGGISQEDKDTRDADTDQIPSLFTDTIDVAGVLP